MAFRADCLIRGSGRPTSLRLLSHGTRFPLQSPGVSGIGQGTVVLRQLNTAGRVVILVRCACGNGTVAPSQARTLHLSTSGPGGLLESRPELHRDLVMAKRRCSWNPFGNKAVIRSWRTPLRTPRFFGNSFLISSLREQRRQSFPVSFTIRTRTGRDSPRPPEPFREPRTRDDEPRTLPAALPSAPTTAAADHGRPASPPDPARRNRCSRHRSTSAVAVSTGPSGSIAAESTACNCAQ